MEKETIKKTKKQVYKNAYEEISEKKTSKLGYILLIIMVIFTISVGETIFSDLRDLPERPTSPSYCVSMSDYQLTNMTYLNCSEYNEFNEIDKQFELDNKYNVIKPNLEKIISLNKDINSASSSINDLKYEIKNLNNEYNLSLQEKMANETAIMNKDNIKNTITSQKKKLKEFENTINSLEEQKTKLITKITPSINQLEENYKEANEYYQTQMAWYKLKVFALTLIFILPFFIFSVSSYLRLKKKNSPNTIILTASTTAFSILFLQVVTTFLYEILPKTWFSRVFTFLFDVPFLRYIIYYGSVIMIIGIFGGIVYYIQKKVFDPIKVAVRRLKDKKCPSCSFVLDSDYKFCPDCGLKLKEPCPHCEKLKIRYLSHCPHCGKE